MPAERKIIIITAPSGAGKTSITHYLLQRFPRLEFSISAATREKRSYETEGKDYYFISVEEFRNKIKEQAFLEWEMVYEGKYYGTLKSELQRIWEKGHIPILDIDVKGAIHVQQLYPNQTLSLFIQAPSIEELKKRLRSRGTESEEAITSRINKATFETSFQHHFDKTIVNEVLENACAEAEKYLKDFTGWD